MRLDRRQYMMALTVASIRLGSGNTVAKQQQDTGEEKSGEWLQGIEIINNPKNYIYAPEKGRKQILGSVGPASGLADFTVNYRIDGDTGIRIGYGVDSSGTGYFVEISNENSIYFKRPNTRPEKIATADSESYERQFIDISWLKNNIHELRFVNDGIYRRVRIAAQRRSGGALTVEKTKNKGTASVTSITSSPPQLGPGQVVTMNPSTFPPGLLRKIPFLRLGYENLDPTKLFAKSDEKTKIRPLIRKLPIEMIIDTRQKKPFVRLYQFGTERARVYFKNLGMIIRSINRVKHPDYITSKSIAMKIEKLVDKHGKIKYFSTNSESSDITYKFNDGTKYSISATQSRNYMKMIDSNSNRYYAFLPEYNPIVSDRLQMMEKSLLNSGD